jgi:hypothetical protein
VACDDEFTNMHFDVYKGKEGEKETNNKARTYITKNIK